MRCYADDARGSFDTATANDVKPQSPPTPPVQSDSPKIEEKPVVAPPPLPNKVPAPPHAGVGKPAAAIWTMNDEDKDTYVYVLAAIKRRSKFGGSVVEIGVGSTEFDEKMEQALLSRSKDDGEAVEESKSGAVDRDELLRQRMGLDKPGVSSADMSASERLEAELLGTAGLGSRTAAPVTASAAMASLMKKRDAPASVASKPSNSAGKSSTLAVSLHREWSRTGNAALGKFAAKLLTVPASSLAKSIGDSVCVYSIVECCGVSAMFVVFPVG